MNRPWSAVAICGALLAADGASVARAADIKFLSPIAMRAVIAEVAPQFVRSSGHKVDVDSARVGPLTERLLKDDPTDVAILSGPRVEELQKISASGRVRRSPTSVRLMHSNASCWP